MKTVCFEKIGNPLEVLTLKEIEMPNPKPGEIRVKVLGSTINPADHLFIQGNYRYKPVLPQIAGLEGAGIIDSVGDNVTLGKDTLVAFPNLGVWAEYIVIPADEAIVLPKDFPVEKAVQFYLNPFTAWGLLKESKAKAGDWLLLTAGRSAVSKITTQLAKQRNIHTILAIRNLQKASEMKELGADVVLDMDNDLSIQRVAEITSGKGITAALDAVGGKVGTNLLQCLSPFGTAIIYGFLRNDPVQFVNSQILSKNITIKGFGVRSFLAGLSKEEKQEMVQSLIKDISKPSFKLPVARSYTFNQFKEALEESTKDNRNGKVLFLTESN
jgi:NADPH:quinone reductase